MPVRPPTPEEYAKVEAVLVERHTAQPPEVANLDNALHLAEPEVMEYRGKEYRIEPISALDGLRLMQLSAELEAAGKSATGPDAFPAFVGAYKAVVRMIGHLARPSGVRGWLWRLRPNPFRRATMEEVREILGFFGRCQMRSSVRHRGQEQGAPRP